MNAVSSQTNSPAVEMFKQSLIDKPIETRAAAVQLFYSFFNNDSIKEVAEKPEWNNGTGYFNGVCRDEVLRETMSQGEIVKFFTTNGRPGLIVMTLGGPVVFFQRYTDGGPIMFNAPHGMFRPVLDVEDAFDDANDTFPESSSAVVSLFFLEHALVLKSLSSADKVARLAASHTSLRFLVK